MIAVTGANGQLGFLTIQHLLTKTKAENIVALVRNLEKATALKALGVEVRQADYNKPDTLRGALQGIKKLLLISGSEIGQRFAQHQAVINAAKNQSLELFAYTSLLNAPDSPMILAQEHRATEEAINQSGLPAVILRNGWYNENYIQGAMGAVQSGVLLGCAQNGEFNTASRSNYALAAATVLTSTESQAGKIYELAGDSSVTLRNVAALISECSGKTINYHDIAQEEYVSLLTQMGLPKALAAILADSEAQAAKGWLADNNKQLSQLIKQPTTPMSETLKAALT
ncbi:SDR family oxidoreductase [Flavobacterium sp. W21_SRS_FM6]|uniref:SDR family oxidoreductase n=1 Tax=Flavobacterium sp. W21_SRS_FM6 TaxID=3240268 RepID=UPI003F8DEDE5